MAAYWLSRHPAPEHQRLGAAADAACAACAPAPRRGPAPAASPGGSRHGPARSPRTPPPSPRVTPPPPEPNRTRRRVTERSDPGRRRTRRRGGAVHHRLGAGERDHRYPGGADARCSPSWSCSASTVPVAGGHAWQPSPWPPTPSTAGSRAARGRSAAFGARFDMETDAALLLVLSLYVARDLGLWVLAIGLARYVFLAAKVPLPWLRGQAPRGRGARSWPHCRASCWWSPRRACCPSRSPRRRCSSRWPC